MFRTAYGKLAGTWEASLKQAHASGAHIQVYRALFEIGGLECPHLLQGLEVAFTDRCIPSQTSAQREGSGGCLGASQHTTEGHACDGIQSLKYTSTEPAHRWPTGWFARHRVGRNATTPTTTASAQRQPSPRSAASPRAQRPPATPPVTASTAQATANSTELSTSSSASA